MCAPNFFADARETEQRTDMKNSINQEFVLQWSDLPQVGSVGLELVSPWIGPT